MKVKCLYNTGKNLSQKTLDIGWTKETDMGLKINKEYVIYGIIFYRNILEYLTIDEFNKSFWYPSEVFQVIDNRLSSLWYYVRHNESHIINACWGYKELANNENHHDDLIEREPEALEIFYKRKKEMDLEFPDISIKDNATIADSNRLVCSNCIEAWESNSTLAMVECPKCNTVMHNPIYKKMSL